MKLMKQAVLVISLILFIGVNTPSYSQCSMCRAVAASGSKDDNTKVAKGLNNGILYLLSMPYIIGAVGYFIWRKNRKKQAQIQ